MTTINNNDFYNFGSDNNVLESWVSGKNKKCVWLRTDKYTIGLEISPSSDYAGISVRHNSKNPKAHNLVIGVTDDGHSFLQVSDGKTVKNIDLFKMVSFIDDLMDNSDKNE